MQYLRSQLPQGTPIEVWEAGLFWPGSNASDAEVAGETARLVYLLLGNGAERVIFLPMQANNAADEIRFGLLDASFQPRAGYETLVRLADFARKGRVTWADVAGRDGAQTVVGTGASGAQGLAWTNGDPLPVQAPAVTITSLDGKQTGPATSTQLTAEPVVTTAPAAADLNALVGA
jgi:hypothetical protein